MKRGEKKKKKKKRSFKILFSLLFKVAIGERSPWKVGKRCRLILSQAARPDSGIRSSVKTSAMKYGPVKVPFAVNLLKAW